MAITRPATPPARRLLVVLEVDDGDDEEVAGALAVDGCEVERVVRVVGTGSVVLAGVEEGRLVVEEDAAGVEVVDALLTTGCGRVAVVVGVAAVVGAAELAVSGSRVRDAVDGPAEPRAGTVTSGTPGTGTAGLDPTGALPETGPPVVPDGAPDVAGEACPTALPQAANNRPAIP